MIRLATLEDIDAIFRIYQDVTNKSMVDIVKNTLIDFTENIKCKNIYVYEKDFVKAYALFYDHNTYVYIEQLCVLKKYRNEGIGKKLLLFFNIKWDLVEVCCHITDKSTIEFVEKCGFVSSNQITSWYYKVKNP